MSIACWHCGKIAASHPFTARTPDGEKPACCAGCAAAVEMVHDLGLDDYYMMRSDAAPLVDQSDHERTLALFDMPELLATHVQESEDHKTLNLQLADVNCAACCWLIEKVLHEVPGVHAAPVNLATMQLNLQFDKSLDIPPKEAAQKVLELGYGLALPGDPAREKQLTREFRTMLGRLILAGIGSMQSMTYAAVLYLNVLDSSEQLYKELFRYSSLLIATPVVFYSGLPFFQGAWRGLRQGTLNMDLPIAIALFLAWGGSIVNMMLGGDHVYFESAAMFVFFLLISRWLEQHQRHRIQREWQRLQDALPQVVRQVADGDDYRWIGVRQIRLEDELLMTQGEVIPVDAEVLEGEAQVSEAALTGESLPITRKPGDMVVAGSKLLEGRLTIKARGLAHESLVARIGEQVQQAQNERVTVVRDWQKVAPLFTFGILLLAITTMAYHWSSGPLVAFEYTLALLVITCPCALALAVPLSISATLSAGLRYGLLIASPKQLLAMHHLQGVMFDKTGTLTNGEFALIDTVLANEAYELEFLLQIAAALEKDHPHPIARAFDQLAHNASVKDISINRTGAEGMLDGQRWRISGEPKKARPGATCLVLKLEDKPQLWLWVSDQVRPESSAIVEHLHTEYGWSIRLASGDAAEAVHALGRQLHLEEAQGDMTPNDKAQWLAALQATEGAQMMVGDGINDAPALLEADVSVAPANSTSLARQAAGVYLLQDDLAALPVLPALAKRCRSIIWQNLGWTLLYNAIAIPLAMAGTITPWAAALGMATSSLLVTFNANRINRWKASFSLSP